MANEPFMDRWTLNGTEVLLQDHGRNQANGVPVLDENAELPTSYLPDTYASTLKVDPRNPYDDSFPAWVADLASTTYKNRGQDWIMLSSLSNCAWHSRVHFKNIDILLLTRPNATAAVDANEGCYWTDDWLTFNKGNTTSDVYRTRPTSIDVSPNICVVGSVYSTTSTTTQGGVIWSEDGKNWTRATGIEVVKNVYFVRYISFLDLWVCMVSGVGLYWSADGKSWTQGTGGSTSTSIAYLGVFSNLLIAAYNNAMYWSENGKDWTACTVDGSFSNSSIVQAFRVQFRIYKFSGGYYSSSGAWSIDGKHWTGNTDGTNPVQTNGYLLDLRNGYFYGGGARVGNVTSSGPVIENLSSTDIDPVPNFVVYNTENGKYYTFKYESSTYTLTSYVSTDGIHFSYEGATSGLLNSVGGSPTRAFCYKGLFLFCSNSGSSTQGVWIASVDGKHFFTPQGVAPNIPFSPIEEIFMQDRKWYVLSTRPFVTDKYVWVPPESY